MQLTDVKVYLESTESPDPTKTKFHFCVELDNITPSHNAAIMDLGNVIPKAITDVINKNLFGVIGDGAQITADIGALQKADHPKLTTTETHKE